MLPDRVWRPMDVITLVVVTLLATLYGHELWVDRQPPASIPYLIADDPVVPRGGDLTVSGTIIKNRDCPITIRRVYTSPQHGTYRDPREYGAFAPVGTTEFSLTFEIPEELRPGEWHYRSFGIYTCGGVQYAVTSPDVPFTVVPSRETQTCRNC